MRGSIIALKRYLRNGTAIAALLLLGACTASAPGGPRVENGGPLQDVSALLAAAEQALGPQRSDYLLQATALLLRQHELGQAAELLDEIGALQLTPAQRAHHTELRARLLLEHGDSAAAIALLQQPALLQQQGELPAARQIALAQLRARAYASQGDHLASVQQRIAVEPLLNGEQLQRNRAQIWRSLLYMEPSQLQAYRDKALSRELKGWLELALVAKQNQGNLDLQLERLDQWLGQWQGHSAQALPDDLRLLRQAVANQPRQVALLLPLSGPLAAFGQALRDGYMAALYAHSGDGTRTPIVRLYDTQGADARALLRQAVAEGAEAVVGPLEKQQVSALYEEPLPVPVLALNRADLESSPPPNLYQFSLAPEDEAVQLAALARAERHRNALLITPEADANSREVAAFARRWEQLGGRIVAQALFRDQQSLSDVIRSALNIPQSQARAAALERTLGRNLEFSPRRRQDVDLVVMIANPAQARSIKPTLAYHFAAELPVFALSRSYAGAPQPDIDQDLDGMRFTEMPWILNDSPLKRTIATTLNPPANLLRFYAMGVDSFYLQPRLAQLAQLPESRILGQSGALRLDSRRVVQRELPLAVMRNGRPQETVTALQRLDEIPGDGAIRAYEQQNAREGVYERRKRDEGRFD